MQPSSLPGPTVRSTRWRGWRWILRGALAIIGVVVVAVAALLIILHTAWGREVVRRQVEQKLATTFVGGATLGGLEGSPFGTLTLRDLVIHGPDGKPAISVKTLNVSIGILPLLSHQARVGAVVAEDVDVSLLRDAQGDLAIKHLLKPGPSSGWSVGLPKVEIRRAHIVVDTGSEIINLDGVDLDAKAELPHGGPIDASVDLKGTWRERQAAALALQAVVHSDDSGVTVPSLSLRAGDVKLSGNHVAIGLRPGKAPVIGGALSIDAGAAAVARLLPNVQLPADIAVKITATPIPGQPWTELAVAGRIGDTDVVLSGTADLDAKQAKGELSTGTLDLTKLTSGKVEGTASAQVNFDVRPGGPNALPIATATARGWATVAGLPTTTFDLSVSSAGERAEALVHAAGEGVNGTLAAKLRIAGEQIAIEDATLKVVTTDPARASGGKAPVHGSLNVDLAAHGAVRPTPALAVTGTIDGKRLRMKDLSVASLHVALDAKRLPDRPFGSVKVDMTEIVRGDMHLGALKLTAADRADGKIAVTLRSTPVQNPWMIELDALVTPPGEVRDDHRRAPPRELPKVVVDLSRHHVRAASGGDWYGTTGHIEIGPERIAVRDLVSTSKASRLAIAGSYDRAGRGAGDLTATLDAKQVSLDNVEGIYHGAVDAHVEVSRRAGAWQGDVAVDATKVSVDPKVVPEAVPDQVKTKVAEALPDPTVSSALPPLPKDAPKSAVVKSSAPSTGTTAPPSNTKSAPTVVSKNQPAPTSGQGPTPTTTTRGNQTPTPVDAGPGKPAPVASSTVPDKNTPTPVNAGPGKPSGAPGKPPASPAEAATAAATGAAAAAARSAAKPSSVLANGPKAEAQRPAQPILIDAHVRAKLRGRQLSTTTELASAGVGQVKLALELSTPAVVTDAKAWQRLDRSAIRTGELTLAALDVRRLAELAGAEGLYQGRIDGSVQLSAQTIGGRITVQDLSAPALRGGDRPVGLNLVLDVAQTSATELAPTLTATIPKVGTVIAKAQLMVPEKLFEPAAWAALGPRMLHGASVRADNIAVDPAMLDRFGVIAELRGKVSAALEIGEAASTIRAVVDIAQLRGKPVLDPIDVHFDAEAGDDKTTVALSIKSKTGPLVVLEAQVPLAVVQLARRFRDDPAGVKATKLAATAKLAATDAAQLLRVLGRTEVTGGRIDGTLELGGTIGTPTLAAHLVATALKVPPGPRGKPVRTVEKLTITGNWDGRAAKLDVDGVESDGGTLKISGAFDPKALADGSLTLKAQKLDLVPLLAFLPGPAGGASGTLDANLTLKGFDLRTTKVAGELHLVDARVPIAPSVGTLRRAKIDAVIGEREIKVTVDGKLGSGSVKLDGAIALDGAAPSGGKAVLTLREVSPIGSIEPKITADVNATLKHENNQWKADLVVDNAFVLVPNDRGEKLKPPGPPSDMRFANGKRITTRPLERAEPTSPIFVVAIHLHSTQVESDEIRGLIKGTLEARADGEAIAITGGIDADRGDLDLFGHRYQVERASVHFDGALDPLLDVRITHDFPDVTTVTEIHGRASSPELTLSSEPGTYSQGELLGFLLGGEPGGGDAPPGSTTDRVAGAGASFVANKLGGYVRDALPVNIDVLRYEAATATSGAAVLVGTWITRSLFVAYRQHLESRADENTGEGEVEYWLSRRVMIEGTAGNNGYNGVDLLWRKRY
jgi:autotransporter translocation and assembly factor TamB